MTERKERCKSCIFWTGPHPAEYEDNRGACHRNAPRPLSIDNDEHHFGLWTWPMVTPGDWCGEWQSLNSKPASTPFPWNRVSTRCRAFLQEAVQSDKHDQFDGATWPLMCEDLVNLGRQYLLRCGIRNWGKKSADEITAVLKELGFESW